jgi:hypothetical protein
MLFLMMIFMGTVVHAEDVAFKCQRSRAKRGAVLLVTDARGLAG